MKHFLVLLLFLTTSGAPLLGAAESLRKAGDILWENRLKTPADFQAGHGAGTLAPEAARGYVLTMTNSEAGQNAVRSFVLPVEKLRGMFVFLGADVKAEDVSPKPNAWNGIKVMAVIDQSGAKQYPQPEIGVGTFGWQRFSTRLFVPSNATAVTLVLGLEQVKGKVWFDNVRFVFAKDAAPAQPAPASQPIFRGHALPGLRGAMIAPASLTENDFKVLANEWGANLVRWQLIRPNKPGAETGLETYDRWLDEELKRLDRGLAWAGSLGVQVVVDLHSPPGGKATDGGYQAAIGALWTDPAAQAKFVEVWQKIANRYKGDKRIWGYDLVNEPDDSNTAEGCEEWQALALRTGRAVREIDPDCTLIIEPPSWGGPQGFIGFQPLELTNVVYSFHMYHPMGFTHQGVFSPSPKVIYPGLIAGAAWDKAALEKSMEPAIEFARRYRVQMYVGEFSAIRWAPGAESYLSDLIDIFEAHGWDWSYHAFREWDGWSVEHGTDKNDRTSVTEPTARKQVLLKWMKQNKRAEPGK